MMNEWVDVIKEIGKVIEARDETNIRKYASLIEQQQRFHHQDTLILVDHLVKFTEEMKKARLRPTQRLPEFDGTNMNIDDWEEKVREIIIANDWDIGLILVYLPLSLKGQARQSFNNLRGEDTLSKESLFQAIRYRLDPEVDTRNKENFINAKKLPGESMISFIDRCRTFIKRSGGDATENFAIQMLKRKVMENIQSTDRKVLLVMLKATDDLDKIASIADAMMSRGETIGFVNENNQLGINDAVNIETTKKTHQKQEQKPQEKQIGPCGKCHQWGHTRKYCPKRIENSLNQQEKG